ncbi:protein-export chaperone SecB [Lutibacter holmesii]|uniref:Protein-export chaperone SecB n=1 Tax=Lutibacter holmesii TaxID=1137985 RepID=A0ABW3WNA4_9FLAO
MKEVQKAAFSFEQFKVPQFSYNENNNNGNNLKIGLEPRGTYNSKTGEFILSLNFISHNEDNLGNFIFQLNSIAVFKFESNIEYTEIPNYFYKNAIAIMFPYLRAFISTLTLQANTKLLKLGLMNLTGLEIPLKENISII